MHATAIDLSLIDALPDATFLVDREWRFVYLNERAMRRAGVPREQITGRRIWEAYPTLVGGAFESLYRDTMSDRVPREVELWVDDSAVWYRVSVSPFADGLLVQYRDVTARRRMDEELRARAEWRRQLIENLPIGAAYLEGGRLHVNRATERITGYTRHELSTLDAWFTTLHSEEHAEARARYELARDGGFRGTTITSLRRKDGIVRLVEVAVSKAGDQEVWVLNDVTERLDAERALHESELALQAVIHASPLAIETMDTDGRVRMWNPAAVSMFGWTAAEVVGSANPTTPPELTEEHAALFDAEREGLEVRALETRRRRKDGSTIDVQLSSAPLRDAAGEIRGVVSVIADVTERKLLEQQLLQAQKMDAIGRLAGGVAHDFNNLLTAISAYSELLLASLDARDPRCEEAVEIRKAAQRGAGLTRQLLSFSRKQVVQPQVVTTDSVVSSLANLMRRLIGEDIELALQATAVGACVRVDPGQLEQAVVNLVVNARDAMPNGGRITLGTRCADVVSPILHPHGFVRPGPWVVITVRDSGSGMTPEVMSHLFEPFFTTKAPGKGTGLGLSTVYGIVKQSGGHVLVESAPGAGSAFHIYLPRAGTAEIEARADAGANRQLGGAETVLLVEDEEAVRNAVRRILESAGYRVLCAANGQEALKIAESHADELALLVTDVIMPQMGGRELVERLTTRQRGIKTLYISGYTGDAVPGRSALGPHPYVQKPFTANAILGKVRELLDEGVRA